MKIANDTVLDIDCHAESDTETCADCDGPLTFGFRTFRLARHLVQLCDRCAANFDDDLLE